MEASVLSRRNFVKSASFGVGAVVVATLLPKKAFAAGQLQTTISSNHGHAFEISLADLINNGGQTYDIKGRSGHSHSLIIND
jgi:hypothetical protein